MCNAMKYKAKLKYLFVCIAMYPLVRGLYVCNDFYSICCILSVISFIFFGDWIQGEIVLT